MKKSIFNASLIVLAMTVVIGGIGVLVVNASDAAALGVSDASTNAQATEATTNVANLVEHQPTDPKPTTSESAPTDPAPEETVPSEPVPTEPAPIEPQPTEPAPTEPINPMPQVHVHSYTAVVTEPTCSSEGYTTYTCECGDSYIDNWVTSTLHRYVSKVVVPTCETGGYTEHTCSVCGYSYTDSYKGCHNYVVTDEVKPTCGRSGYTTYTCECGDTYTKRIAAIGHDFEVTVVDPTATDRGYMEHVCSNCGHCFRDSFVSPIGVEHDHECCCGGHVEVIVGEYTYVYCTNVDTPYQSDDGKTIYYPHSYYKP